MIIVVMYESAVWCFFAPENLLGQTACAITTNIIVLPGSWGQIQEESERGLGVQKIKRIALWPGPTRHDLRSLMLAEG